MLLKFEYYICIIFDNFLLNTESTELSWLNGFRYKLNWSKLFIYQGRIGQNTLVLILYTFSIPLIFLDDEQVTSRTGVSTNSFFLSFII